MSFANFIRWNAFCPFDNISNKGLLHSVSHLHDYIKDNQATWPVPCLYVSNWEVQASSTFFLVSFVQMRSSVGFHVLWVI